MLLLPGVPCSITYWSREFCLHLSRLEYPVRLPTEAEIFVYVSPAWSTLFDYLLEQRFISMPFLPGVPCSITYWAREVSLRLSLLEHPLQLPTGTEIYLSASSAWSTLFDYLLEQRGISMPLLPVIPCSITYWSIDLSLFLFCLEYPVRLSTGAEIYLYASSAWSNLFYYLLGQRFISTPLPSGVPCSITYWSGDLSVCLFCLKYPVRLSTAAEIYVYASIVWSIPNLTSSLIEANYKDISFSKREARDFLTCDGEVLNTWRCTSTPICH